MALTKKQIVGALKTRSRNIAKERDALRELQDEVDELACCCEDAVNELESCIDRLSELL